LAQQLLAWVVMERLAFLLWLCLAACSSGSVDASDSSCFGGQPPTQVAALPNEQLPAHEWKEGDPLVIDVSRCESGRWFTWLPLGSAWVMVRPSADGCELWLGGETENPMYDGSASQYCRFLRNDCEAHIEVGQGGPAHLQSGACTP